MELTAYLYDANGQDRKLELTENTSSEINNDQILWIDVAEREEETLKYIFETLKFKDVPIREF